jgi:predicted GNAT family acetyltransferase
MDLFNFVDYEEQDFSSWYVDISHRVRHKTAKAYTLNVNGEIISSGILSSIVDGCAILTAVRTGEAYRKMGYGSCLVNNICCDVADTVYIMRDMNLNESFYKNCGFKNIGKWRMYK